MSRRRVPIRGVGKGVVAKMFEPDQHQLLDFGGGRKLERFGRYVLDRPAPAAESKPRSSPSLWKAASARYERTAATGGAWRPPDALPEGWTIVHGGATLQLKATSAGQVGVFPEQAENWDWIDRRIRRSSRPLQVLNLFSYTGGATLAAAAAGARVVHVDAARSALAWARRNAELSGLPDAPIRWIADDAAKFVRREIRREARYDAVVLDPPSYGHGPKGEPWKIQRDLRPLLESCCELIGPAPAFLVLTCHTPEYRPSELESLVREAMPRGRPGRTVAKRLAIRTADRRRLTSGVVVRWTG